MDVDSRSLKRQVEGMLRSEEFELHMAQWLQLPARRAINPLLSFLCSPDETVKWRAVTAIGIVASHLADQDMESARVIMRRLMWSLNDESGGIGWGSAEAMGEIMACHEELAREYAHILISYIDPDGNPLDNDLLARGALWGLGRLAQERAHLLKGADTCLAPYLASKDPLLRALALWALVLLGADLPDKGIEALLRDRTEIRTYVDRKLTSLRICDLAEQAKRMR